MDTKGLMRRQSKRRKLCRGIALAITFACGTLPAEAATFKVEIDFMVDGDDHSHKPSPWVLAAVAQMFACQGHTLLIYTSNAVPHHDLLRRDPDDCGGSLFDYDGSADSFGAIKDTYADHDDGDGWHYCLFAHDFEKNDRGSCVPAGSSGLGERPGWNFVVTLGTWLPGQTGSDFDQAATLAHELGHNLGLTHCGYVSCVGIGNYTPILPSIMSYRYQLSGVRTNLLCNGLTIDEAHFKEIDYSGGRMCSLNENSLNEFFGTGMRSVDWDCDGSFEIGVAHDINGGGNGWCNSSGSRSVITDTDEWARISDPALASSASYVEEVSCITWQEWQNVRPEAAGGCSQPALTTEPCLTKENVYFGPINIPADYSCRRPAFTMMLANDHAPPGSTFFIVPGTYDETASQGTIVLDKPGKWFCTETAVIR